MTKANQRLLVKEIAVRVEPAITWNEWKVTSLAVRERLGEYYPLSVCCVRENTSPACELKMELRVQRGTRNDIYLRIADAYEVGSPIPEALTSVISFLMRAAESLEGSRWS